MKASFKKHSDSVQLELGGGTERRILAWNDQLMLVEVSFDTGAVGTLHSHPHAQCSYVVSGRFRYTVEDETFEMSAGDSIAVQAGRIHGTECLENGMLLDAFTPARKDFL